MCKITNKIKFCTCEVDLEKINELKSFWILYRRNSNINYFSIGSFVLMSGMFYELNQDTILNRLQEKDAFDKDIQFKDDDCLQIFIKEENSDVFYKHILYRFQFNEGKWEKDEYNPIDFNHLYDEIKWGKFENL